MSIVQHHPRRFETNRYVYPVISRRSGGLSVGVNLSPTGLCNFSCVYCQILGEPEIKNSDSVLINVPKLETELRNVLTAANDGTLYANTYLSSTPPEKRVLRDIAFSGDGEPTLAVQFSEIVNRVADIRRELCSAGTKIVLITNGTTLNAVPVRNAVRVMLDNNGEVWAKLDAGTPEMFRAVSRSRITFQKIVDNLTAAAKEFPLVIQSCFLMLHNEPPKETDIERYADVLNSITNSGGTIQRVQIYTVARSTAEKWATPLSDDTLNTLTEIVRQRTGLQIAAFYSK
ncbi:MAG: radical SAM protein [Planctomycetaceae bacterium]|nr:radical SAM protein [Planctomycetaceae bacterium]